MSTIQKRQFSPTHVALVAAAAFTACYAVWVGLRIGGDEALRYLSQVIFQLPPTAATAACAFAAWRSRGRERLGWASFAAGIASWTIAEWVWSGYDLLLGEEPPLFSLADPFYYLAYPFVMAAVVLLVTPARGPRLDGKSLLDALLLATVLGVIAWKWLLIPIYENTEASTFDLLVTFGYPTLDLALLAVIILAFYRAQGALGTPAVLLVAGAVTMTMADSVYFYMATVSGYDVFGNPVELGWVVSYCAFGIAAIAHVEGRSRAASQAPHAPAAWSLRTLGLLLPYAALTPLVAINVYQLLMGAPDGVMSGGIIVATVLVASRQFITLRELSASRDALESANVQLQAGMGIEHHLARTDSLTGIPNRRFIDELAEAEVARARRYGQDLAVVMADLDDLKGINDAHGHHVGDETLRYVAQVARESCRQIDVVGRYGGDEFVFVLPATSRDQAATFAERVRRCLAESPVPTSSGGTLHVTASFGVSQWDDAHMEEPACLIRQADRAMYAAKSAGRNRTMVAIGDAARAA